MKMSYPELIRIPSFEERFKALQICQRVGEQTFGGYRNLSQDFYESNEWRNLRWKVITRDLGCDLAHPDYQLIDNVTIHHINPIPVEMLVAGDYSLALDMDNLITTCLRTHNAIHYSKSSPYSEVVVRRPNDTCPWK